MKKVDARLRGEIGANWRKKWEEEISYPIKKRVSEDWIGGRASIPLIAIKTLEKLGCKKLGLKAKAFSFV